MKKIINGFTPETLAQMLTYIKEGDPEVLNMRCVYKMEDPDIIYFLPLLEFLESKPEYDTIKSFYVCQMV